MSTNELICNSVGKVMKGDLRILYTNTPGYCLAVTRQIIEHALNIDLYRDYVHSWVQPANYPRDHGHWARDFERDAKLLGWAVPAAERQPGDIVFNWRSAWSQRWRAYIGHVGILYYDDMIFENIDASFRGRSYSYRALSLTPYGDWPITLVARIPESVL